MIYNVNVEAVNCLFGEKTKHVISGNSHLCPPSPRLTAHHFTDSCLLQFGTENGAPSTMAGGIFPLGRQIFSSAPSCSQVNLSLMFWYFLSWPTASHWKVRPFWSTTFVRGHKGSSVLNGEWRCLIVLPSERTRHEILSPGALGHVADTKRIIILNEG